MPPKSANAKVEEQKLKENDEIVYNETVTNDCDLIAFTDKCQAYKARLDDFDEIKPSALGDYIPAKLKFDDGENVMFICVTKDYSGSIAFFYENGKALTVPLKAYETKTNRKKLANAYSADSKSVGIFFVPQNTGRSSSVDFLLKTSGSKAMIINSYLLTEKVTRSSSGVIVFTLKKGQILTDVSLFTDDGSEEMKEFSRYRKTKVPSTGTTITSGKQLSLI